MLLQSSIRPFPNAVLVEFHADALDEANALNLAGALLDVLQEGDASTLYLNFREVRSVADLVWLELFSLSLYLRETGGRLCVLNLSPSLSRQLHRIEQPDVAATQEVAM